MEIWSSGRVHVSIPDDTSSTLWQGVVWTRGDTTALSEFTFLNAKFSRCAARNKESRGGPWDRNPGRNECVQGVPWAETSVSHPYALKRVPETQFSRWTCTLLQQIGRRSAILQKHYLQPPQNRDTARGHSKHSDRERASRCACCRSAADR